MDNITIMLPTEDVSQTPQTADIYNSTQTPWTAADTVELSAAALWVYLAVRILWGVLAVFGNSITMVAVRRFERLQTCTNYFICSLAVSDLLSGLMVPLVMAHDLYPNSWSYIPTCLLEKTLTFISSSGNMVNILYLSIDRYIYVAFPLRYHGLVTPHRVAVLLTITWVAKLLCVPLVIFTSNHLHVGMPCKFLIFLDDWAKRIYIFPQFFFAFILTIGFHLAIARIAYSQARRIQEEEQPYNTLDVAINRSTKKISRTLATVLGVYLFSITPQVVIAAIVPMNRDLLPLERFTTILYWANTWINPLIYTWRLKDFRIAFKKIFTGRGSFNEVPGIPV